MNETISQENDPWSVAESYIRACKIKIELGRYGDAVKAFESDGVHELNDYVKDSLRETHTEGVDSSFATFACIFYDLE